MQKLVFAVVVLIGFLGHAAAQTASEYEKKSFAHWTCATYLSVSSSADVSDTRHERHFLAGLEAARALYAELKSKGEAAVAPDDAPWLLFLPLAGPTPDFVAGRLFEGTTEFTQTRLTQGGDSALWSLRA
ncbi:MAG: hypothetical protein ACK5TQ_02500, partial [Acetobacteraceae bacterium]